MIDFNKYKKDISLPDFLVNVFEFFPVEGSSNSYPKLRDPLSGQTIVIRKNSQGHYTYFDIHNDLIKGKTILDVVQQKLSQHLPDNQKVNLVETCKFIDLSLKSGKDFSSVSSKFVMRNEAFSKEFIDRSILDLKPDFNREFFYKRGITDKTLDHPLFSGLIHKKLTFDKENDVWHENVAFKMYSSRGAVALSMRNENFKGCLGSRGTSVCITNLNNSKPIDSFYICESMIDNMSHFELNYDKLKDKNIVYMSSEGSFVDGQIAAVQQAVSYSKPKEFINLFDNDSAGLYYRSKLDGKLFLPDFYYAGVESTASYKQNLPLLQVDVFKLENAGSLEISFNNSDKELSLFLESKFNEANKNLENMFPDKPFQVLIIPENSQTSKFSVHFTHNYECWKSVAEVIEDIKFSQVENYKAELPMTKDFNDDLRCLKGISKDWKIDVINNKQHVMFRDKSIGVVPAMYRENYKDYLNKSNINKQNGLIL